jgi:hypothetical protein
MNSHKYAPNKELEKLLTHLDQTYVRLVPCGCFAALSPDKSAIFVCPMTADGSADRDPSDPYHMNWSEVTVPETDFLDHVNAAFGTSFHLEKFAGR